MTTDSADPSLTTPRLHLRRWEPRDRAPFAALNADPEVMAHFPSTLTRDESDAFVDRIEAHFERHGWGLWAVERRADAAFVGFLGLWPATFEAHFTPAVEIGWRFARHGWGAGLATEAGHATLADARDRLEMTEIVSFTTVANHRSSAVMERLGMTNDPAEDFDHPGVDGASHPHLVRHRLYRVTLGVGQPG